MLLSTGSLIKGLLQQAHMNQVKTHFFGRENPDTPILQEILHFFIVLLPFTMIMGSGVVDVNLSLVAVLFLARSAHSKDWSWLKQPWLQVALVLWVYLFIRSFFALEIDDSLRRAAPWIRYPIFAAALAETLMKHSYLTKRLLRSLIIATLFLTGDTIIQYFAGVDLFGRESIPQVDGSFRLTGTFSAPKAGIVLTWMMFPVVATLIHKQPVWRGIVISIIMSTTIFLTGERMAVLLAIFGFFVLTLLKPVVSRKIIPILLMTVATIVIITTLNPALMERQGKSSVEVIKNVEQTPYGMLWVRATNIIEKNPIFGVGLRHFRIACPHPKYGPMDNIDLRCNLHPHHLYLEWAVEAGLVGLALFIVMLGFWMRTIWKNYSWLKAHHAHSFEFMLFMGLVAEFAIRVWPLSTAVSFHVAWSAAPFWLIIGWLMSYQRRDV